MYVETPQRQTARGHQLPHPQAVETFARCLQRRSRPCGVALPRKREDQESGAPDSRQLINGSAPRWRGSTSRPWLGRSDACLRRKTASRCVRLLLLRPSGRAPRPRVPLGSPPSGDHSRGESPGVAREVVAHRVNSPRAPHQMEAGAPHGGPGRVGTPVSFRIWDNRS